MNHPTMQGKWLGFTPNMDVGRAKERFRERFGYEPKEVYHVPGLLLVGPIAEERDAVVPHVQRDAP